MATRKSAPQCEFEKLVTRNVPHILEMIFFDLDYYSFAACGKVCKAWGELFSSQSYKRRVEKLRVEVVRSGLTRFTKRYGTMHAKKEEERKNDCPPRMKYGEDGKLWPTSVVSRTKWYAVYVQRTQTDPLRGTGCLCLECSAPAVAISDARRDEEVGPDRWRKKPKTSKSNV